MKMYLIHRTLLVTSIGIVPWLCAGETVGTVVTPGRMFVNNLTVEGNATLSEGAVLKTSATAARVDLIGGGAVSLDAESVAVAKRGQMQLRQGKGMVTSPAGRIEALGLQIDARDPQSQALVAVLGGRIEVAALRGTAQVRNQQGMILALVHKGRPLSFEPGNGRPESTITGTLRREGSTFLLRDELTGTDVELRGDAVASRQGQRIQAGGVAQISGDSDNHVVLVSRLNRLDTEAAPETAPGSSSTSNSTASAAAKTGMSAGTKIGLAALAFGGMAAAIAVPLAMSN